MALRGRCLGQGICHLREAPKKIYSVKLCVHSVKLCVRLITCLIALLDCLLLLTPSAAITLIA